MSFKINYINGIFNCCKNEETCVNNDVCITNCDDICASKIGKCEKEYKPAGGCRVAGSSYFEGHYQDCDGYYCSCSFELLDANGEYYMDAGADVELSGNCNCSICY